MHFSLRRSRYIPKPVLFHQRPNSPSSHKPTTAPPRHQQRKRPRKSLIIVAMDQSLDQVRNTLVGVTRTPFSTFSSRIPLFQIIAARPKNTRRGSARRTSAGRTQVLGNPVTSPATRARQAAAAAAIVAKASPSTTGAQPADKIIVSNLPQDVNEAQIKVIAVYAILCGLFSQLDLRG